MEINFETVSLHVPIRVAHAEQIEDAEFEDIVEDGED